MKNIKVGQRWRRGRNVGIVTKVSEQKNFKYVYIEIDDKRLTYGSKAFVDIYTLEEG